MRYVDIDAIKADLERQMDRSNPNWSFTNEAACYDLLEYLNKFPVIDPVNHGKWIYDGDCIICSKCRKAFGFISTEWATNFCPDCGADMRGKDNG